MRKIKLFCFPYAGGSAVVYNKWKPLLDAGIELKPIELAGRGKRIFDPPYKDFEALIADVFRIVKDQISTGPYALFGHSMGGLIAYNLAQKIRAHQLAPPLHVFFSGRGAPHVEEEDEKIFHLMGDEEFKKEVILLGGTPPESFEHQELMAMFLPILKNDFKMIETAAFKGDIRPLGCDITALLGREDDLTPAQCEGWKEHTDKTCNIHYFEGGHFFINDAAAAITGIINGALAEENYSEQYAEVLTGRANQPSR
jgi:surfactin synthase thioesterase subunit